eukprot:TRINITY_DN8001_c0_g1_i1.p1 TRINITY_DN8001_c0_g1~~TRINITY_DN8001_c0_g1_i1.p1  ORF type:complete len:481 (+),score=134.21 TRINITY_DN8001_c0_g1_i1:388-1830(+)
MSRVLAPIVPKNDLIGALLDKTAPACEPELVAWTNLASGRANRGIRNCCANVVLFIVIVVIFSGATLLDIADTFISAFPEWVASSFTSYVPTFVTFLTAWVLVPLLLELAAGQAHIQRHDQWAIWYLRRYFAYLILAVVFVTTTTMSIAALIDSLVSTKSASDAFATVFDAEYTIYFIKYTLNFALLSSPFELLQVPEVLVSQLESCISCCSKHCCSITAKKLTADMFGVGIPSIALFEYPRQYVLVLHIFAIGLLYSAVTPTLGPFVLLFLLVKRKVDCTNLLLQPKIPLEAQAGLFTGTVDVAVQPLNMVMVMLGITQLGMIYFFASKDLTGASVGTVVIFWLTTGFYFVALLCKQVPYKKLSRLAEAVRNVEERVENVLGETAATALGMSLKSDESPPPENAYEHPALKRYLGDRQFVEVVGRPPLSDEVNSGEDIRLDLASSEEHGDMAEGVAFEKDAQEPAPKEDGVQMGKAISL